MIRKKFLAQVLSYTLFDFYNQFRIKTEDR